MATLPVYASSAIRLMAGLVPASADTSFTAPTTVTTLGAAGANGTKIVQIDIEPVGTTVSGLVNLFAYDGTNYRLLETVTITAATVSTTVGPAKTSYAYDNLVLPSASWSLRCTTTVAGNASLVQVTAFGGDF